MAINPKVTLVTDVNLEFEIILFLWSHSYHKEADNKKNKVRNDLNDENKAIGNIIKFVPCR